VESSQYLVLPECSEVDEDCLVRALEQAAGVAAARLPVEAEDEEEAEPTKPAAGRGKKNTKANESADGSAPVKAGRKKKEAAKAPVPESPPPVVETALIVVRLRNCGRGMTDRTAAVCINLAQGKLEILQLTGCFRLNDAALSGLLLSCRSSLMSLDLTCNSRLSGEALSAIRRLDNLQELTLDNCTQLVDADLLKLLPPVGGESSSSSSADSQFPPLVALSLSGLIEVTGASVVPLIERYGFALQTLNLSGCVKLTDETLRAVRRHCESLRVLGLCQLGETTTAAMLGLFVVHPGVRKEYAGDLSTLSTARRDGSSGSAATADDAFGASAGLEQDVYVSARIGHLEEVYLQGTVCVTDDVIVQLCEGNKRTLRALDVNGCYQLTSRAIMALRKHCQSSLQSLDLSFVRGCSQEALGALVDAGIGCDALQTLTVWGCTQLGDKFWKGYRKDSNLQVVGRMTA
jgi:DNA repair protein RAD7